jgi:hypothetical protein
VRERVNMTRLVAGEVKVNRRDLSLAHGVWGTPRAIVTTLSSASQDWRMRAAIQFHVGGRGYLGWCVCIFSQA